MFLSATGPARPVLRGPSHVWPTAQRQGVNTGRAHILEKLDVKNNAELTRYGAQHQLVE
jgi:hypothetical protein